MTTPADYINFGYVIAKYEAMATWHVELDRLRGGRWKLRWKGWEDNVDGEETTEGTIEELTLLIKEATVECEPSGIVY